MSDQLPHDLQIDILVRLPVKSLLRFQCVSKSWKSLIRSTGFNSMHTNHNESTNNCAHLFHFSRSLHQFDDSFSEFQEIEFPSQTKYQHFREVIGCRGLLLWTYPSAYTCNGDRFEPFILWNPAVRMSMTLPRPCIHIFNIGYSVDCVLGFGFDHKSNDYKVLRIFYRRHTISPPRAELFKLRTGAWETVTVIDDFHYRIRAGSKQAFVNGATHWLGCGDYLKFTDLAVVLFHMSNEEFRVMKLPDCLTSVKCHLISLIVSGGLLSLIHYIIGDGNMSIQCDSCCIWSMKDYGVIESWTKQCIIDSRDCGGSMSILTLRNNRAPILLVRGREEIVLYDPKTNRFINLGIRNLHLLSVITYIESLDLLNQVNAMPEYQTSSTSSRKRMRLPYRMA